MVLIVALRSMCPGCLKLLAFGGRQIIFQGYSGARICQFRDQNVVFAIATILNFTTGSGVGIPFGEYFLRNFCHFASVWQKLVGWQAHNNPSELSVSAYL